MNTACLVEGTVRQFSERIPESPKRNRKFPYRKVAEIEAEIQKSESRIELWIEELHHILAEPDTLRALYEHWEEAAEMN